MAGLLTPGLSHKAPPDGVYENMPEEEYRSYPALSYSAMKFLELSPLQFWHNTINPDGAERRDTKALEFGRALHCAVLEPNRFKQEYCREFSMDCDGSEAPLRTVKEMRKWILSRNGKPRGVDKTSIIGQVLSYDDHPPVFDRLVEDFATRNADKRVLDDDTFDRVIAAAEALRSEPRLIPILEDGKPEVSLFWTDPETGVKCKARPDWMTKFATLDLKTFAQKIPQPIDRCIAQEIFHRKYYRQAWFYTYARKVLNLGEKPFVIAFVESEAPYETRLKVLQPDHLYHLYWELGRQETRQFIRLYAEYWSRFGTKPWRDPQEITLLEDAEIPQLAYV